MLFHTGSAILLSYIPELCLKEFAYMILHFCACPFVLNECICKNLRIYEHRIINKYTRDFNFFFILCTCAKTREYTIICSMYGCFFNYMYEFKVPYSGNIEKKLYIYLIVSIHFFWNNILLAKFFLHVLCSAPSSFECQFRKELPLLYEYLQEAPTNKVFLTSLGRIFSFSFKNWLVV